MYKEFESLIGYNFKNTPLLTQAFTHSSYYNENRAVSRACNERLEFLGDAVLELIISNYLYRHYPKLPEGELTKFRANIVCEPSLAKIAREIGLGSYLLLGKGEANNNGCERNSILADAFEAVIGAIYLDGGIDCAQQFIMALMEREISLIYNTFRTSDHKTYLQEIIQMDSSEPLIYKTVGEEGPDHNKTFSVQVFHGALLLGAGAGKSKKEAEQSAALNAINRINCK